MNVAVDHAPQVCRFNVRAEDAEALNTHVEHSNGDLYLTNPIHQRLGTQLEAGNPPVLKSVYVISLMPKTLARSWTTAT